MSGLRAAGRALGEHQHELLARRTAGGGGSRDARRPPPSFVTSIPIPGQRANRRSAAMCTGRGRGCSSRTALAIIGPSDGNRAGMVGDEQRGAVRGHVLDAFDRDSEPVAVEEVVHGPIDEALDALRAAPIGDLALGLEPGQLARGSPAAGAGSCRAASLSASSTVAPVSRSRLASRSSDIGRFSQGATGRVAAALGCARAAARGARRAAVAAGARQGDRPSARDGALGGARDEARVLGQRHADVRRSGGA